MKREAFEELGISPRSRKKFGGQPCFVSVTQARGTGSHTDATLWSALKGVPVQAGRDWIEIGPARPRPARIACHGDHRIAMAFSVAGLRIPGITLDDPGCVKKTFPGFHAPLAALQAAWQHDQ